MYFIQCALNYYSAVAFNSVCTKMTNLTKLSE